MNMDEIIRVLGDLYPKLVYTIHRDFESEEPYDKLVFHQDNEQPDERKGARKPSRQVLEDRLRELKEADKKAEVQ